MIAPDQARTLRLRTGTGFRRSYTAVDVARILGVSVIREAGIERAAVAALGDAARDGSCPGMSHTTAPPDPRTSQAAAAPAAPESQATLVVAPPPRPIARDRPAGRSRPVRRRRRAVSAATAGLSLAPAGSGLAAGDDSVLITLGVIAAVLAVAVTARGTVLRPAVVSGPAREREAYGLGDERGDPAAATSLGVWLEQQGDVDGALAAYRRADERGDAAGAFNLGLLLAELGDRAGAFAAFQHADERGDAAAASNLGVMLERQGEIEAALAAYRRADERGNAVGAFNLGVMLARRGDLSGARAAYCRASERGAPEIAEEVHAALAELDGAE